MLMVEQNIRLASAISERCFIIRDGAVADTKSLAPGQTDEAELARRI